jgi:glycosyltransferase involved in cell wall biosynthesis
MPDKLSVALLVNKLVTGGAERQIVELAGGLDKSRFNVYVVTLQSGGSFDRDVAALPGVELRSLERSGRFDFTSLFRLVKLLRSERIDIVQPYLTPATFFGLTAGLIARTPILLVTERGGSSLIPFRPGAKVYTFLERKLARFASAGIPNSEAGMTLLRQQGIPPEKVRVIYNGISASRVSADSADIAAVREQYRIPDGAGVISIVARLEIEKDHPTLLRALALLRRQQPSIVCLIVGDGVDRPALESLSEELGLGDIVRFTGNQRLVAPFIAASHVAVLCSRDVEGCSNFLLEAMAMGKPLVATDIGGNRELVRDGENGRLVPVGKPEALAEALGRVLSHEDDGELMGMAGRRDFEARFTVSQMVSRYADLYTSLVSSGSLSSLRERPAKP